jgi:hypothetical protein
MDDATMKKIVSELEADGDADAASREEAAAKKAKNKVEFRLALEKKSAARKSGKKGSNAKEADEDFDDTDAALSSFVKAKKK